MKPTDSKSATRPIGFRPPVFVQALVLVLIGGAIGLVDASQRPVKLARTVSDFALGSGPNAATDGSVGAGSSAARAAAGANTAPSAGTEVNAGAALASPPGTPADLPAASNTAAAASASGGFVFTPKAELKPGHITVDEAKAAFDSGGASFVDARSRDKFAEGHVSGAVRLDLDSFREGTPAKLGLLPREHMLIIYCGGGQCDESEQVALQLEKFGYNRIFIVHDGFPGWKAAGHAVETGEDVE